MKTFLTENEVLAVAAELLDMVQPNPDRIHELAERLDMVYNENLDLFEDVEDSWDKAFKRKAITYAEAPSYRYCSVICDTIDKALGGAGARALDRHVGLFQRMEKELKEAGFRVIEVKP